MVNDSEQFINHCLLYAKGWYVKSRNTMRDLNVIARATGFLEKDDPLAILNVLSKFAFSCILQLGDAPTPWRKDKAGNNIVPMLMPGDEENSWEKQFWEAIRFMHANRGEILEKYGPKMIDLMQKEETGEVVYRDDLFNVYMGRMLEENILQGLLVIMAAIDVSEMELPEANRTVLPPADTAKKGKK